MTFSSGAKRLLSSLTVVTCFSATVAEAATLSGTGGVLVNRGGGYKPITGPTEVQPGDSVMVQPGGSATLSYSDGCQSQMQTGVVTSVGATSPCAQAGNNTPTQPPADPSLVGGLDTTSLMIGGLALGAGALGVAALSQKKDGKVQPASP